MIGLLFTVAEARPPESLAESTQDRWASMKDLGVQPALVRPLEAPVTLAQGPETLRLEGGWVVPVFSGHLSGEWEREAERWYGSQDKDQVPRIPSADERGDQVLVGLVWTGGKGSASIAMSDRADGLVLANRMVRDLGVERTAAAPIAGGGPLVAGVTEAIVLSVDPALAEIFAGPQHLDPYEIVVYGASDDAVRAGRRARELFATRSRIWDDLELDPDERIAWDRVAVERGVVGADGGLHWWELQTDCRYGLVAPQLGGDDDRWLAVIGDPTGRFDQRREIRVASLGPGVDGLVSGVPHPPSDPADPTSAPEARIRVEPVFAESTVAASPRSNALSLDVRVDSTLTFRAVGGPAAWIELALPKMDYVDGSFEILAAELSDGTPLLGAAARDRQSALRPDPAPAPDPRPTPAPQPDPGPRPAPAPEPPKAPEPPPEPGEAVVRLHLPTPLQPGQEVAIHLVHVDTWPYGVFADGPTGTLSLGISSGMQYFLPTVAPRVIGSPWKFLARVAVPADGRAVGTISGHTLREFEERGWRVTEADSEGHVAYFPAVAVGKFAAVDDPAQLGFPSIRTRLANTHYGTIDQFGPEVRRVVQFYQGWLPTFPVREVEIFEAPQGLGGGAWIAPHGMVNVQQFLTLGTLQVGGSSIRSDQPHLENAILAHELAHQYWGHLAPPATIEDFWIAESLSELYACMYVAAAFDAKDCQVRLAAKRKQWEAADAPPIDASLTGAYRTGHRGAIVYDYGPYLLGEVVQKRIGREAFFGALDLMLQDHPYEPLTTERLQSYLELASGAELDDAFAYWVQGGYVPSLSLEWTAKGGKVTGTVRSDVPFGTFDVPVRLRGKDAAVDVRVTVRDGVGTLDAEAPAGKLVAVDLDPDGWVLAKRRDSRAAKKR